MSLLRLSRRSTAWFATCLMLALVLVLAGSVRAPAAGTAMLPPGSIVPTEHQRKIAQRVGAILEDAHYRGVKIDKTMSSQIFDRYLSFLDAQHSYFYASDIAEFEQYRYRFDEMIHSGDVDGAYAIFARFQQRNRERKHDAVAMLDTEPNWTLDESFEFDREHAAWPATPAEMSELWRKRVKNDGLSLMLTGKSWKDASDMLRKRYERVVKRVDQITPEDVFEGLMNAYARSFDPHSSYFSPRASEEYRIQMSLNYEGIGASLQLVDDYVTVMNVIEGGPAAVAGTLNTNDRITGVGQGREGVVTDVIGWRLDDVVQLIRGKAGTEVRLQVLPAGAAPGAAGKVLAFVRNKVNLDNAAAKKEVRTITRGDRMIKVGIITVPAFYQDIAAQNAGDENFRSTTRDVRNLINELKTAGVDGIVLDLRGDGGGYLPEAEALTGLFIDKGPVVQLKDTTGHVEVRYDPDSGVAYDGPLAVLVDRFSASASEIFAAAIQDYHRGVIIGQRTFGKGTVQNLVPLDSWTRRPAVNGQLTVTIGKFYRITGESTQHRGVDPDVPLPSEIDLNDVGESSLEAALPWDRIASVPFAYWRGDQHPASALPALALAEDERAQHDPDYHWLSQDVAAMESLRAEKSLSLNLKTRQEERTREDRERLARENLRRTAKGLALLKSVEELDPTEPAEVQLEESTQVMADIVTGASTVPAIRAPAQKTVQAHTSASR